ncbi:MAG: hypothetical protein Q8P49_00120 [Candidatus Liptonbacteria bacterium]|nr:hypothetical protein [Candidatus Liptonbacteria bacterium]
MDNPNMNPVQGKTCNCSHHKMTHLLVVIFGLIFLLANANVLTWAFVGWAWPVLVILAGGMKMMEGKCKCC